MLDRLGFPTRTMRKKLCAISLLVLALSPFTAPFQRCNFGDIPSGADEAVTLTPLTAVPPPPPDDTGTLVPPLTTAAGRLRLSPVSELLIANVVAPLPIAFLA